MRQLTAEDIQRLLRGAGYLIVGTLGQRGIAVDGTWIELVLSLIGGGILLAWSVYGSRINAKIAEMSQLAKRKDTPVAGVIMTNTVEGHEIARSIPGPVVAAGTVSAEALAAGTAAL